MVQPQPHGGSTLQWEMTGEEAVGAGSQGSLMASSQGSLRVPPELVGNEVVHRLLADNHQLREALKRSNDALKDRCEEMEGWQRRSREEREFLSCKFREARALVERLAQENQSLLGKLNHSANHSATQSPGSFSETGSQKNLENPNAESNGLVDSPEALEEANQKHGVEEDTVRQAMHRSLVSSENSPVSSFSPSLCDSLPCAEGLCWVEGEGRACQPSEGSNEFLKLLKSHKEKLEEGMRELRRRNEELEKEKMESEKEKKSLLATVDQLRVKRSQLMQSDVVTVETVPNTNAMTVSPESSHLAKLTEQLQATQGRYRELQEKLNVLEHNSIQRDRIEAVLKQKEKDCVQLTKDIDALRAQVTSLLGELQERQTCLDKCEEERRRLEEKLRNKTESLQNMERDMEQQKKQHFVTMDKLLLQTQNLEAALKNERNVIVEERRKLAQLQHAYTCLFQDYDNKLKEPKHRDGETETLTSRLEDAEKALALKQAHIDKLKEELEQQRSLQETVQVLTAQAEIYKLDFQAEREAREKLNQKKEELQEKLNRALAEINLLKQENMQQRHKDDYRPLPHMPPPGPAMPPPNRNPPDVQPDYRCPKCQYRAPDMDTLQIHVMDCIQ
ncbi:NF-kappa-B essential modulator isoform X1 [Pygocentrus nattereri]|uniref:NF-kappa-B essential modulator n=1 Tax=Pygocentrus nattereri TaxID=42514 RepID=A0A3B4DWN7_PYGNA|nr:NF-kappa-B essential modulator isoform X1 [Pygocentrus nattereri]